MLIGSTIYNWSLIWTYHGQLLNGLLAAIKVALTALVLSVVAGLLLAIWRMAKAPISWPAALYINIFRGIPALVSAIWVYFGWSLVLGIKLTVYQAAVVALVLLYSAYLSEIFRAALLAIARGQREAGLALGMRGREVFFPGHYTSGGADRLAQYRQYVDRYGKRHLDFHGDRVSRGRICEREHRERYL